MTFRIHHTHPGVLFFEGLLDQTALGILRRQLEGRDLLVLGRGTEVAPECLDALRSLKLELKAESAFLARWLQETPPST